MTNDEILKSVKHRIYQQFHKEGTGHDYFHIERVVKTALKIAQKEKADLFLVELAAWLHDVGDYKLNNGTDKSKEQITAILSALKVPTKTISKVITIVSQVSFSKGKTAESIEAKIVQDADRLDAIGAIGIARVFAYGGSKLKEIYNPELNKDSSIQHFYDKLLQIKDRMNTNYGKAIAIKRHDYMQDFLNRFYMEWNGVDD